MKREIRNKNPNKRTPSGYHGTAGEMVCVIGKEGRGAFESSACKKTVPWGDRNVTYAMYDLQFTVRV